jgi:hypothetical protein
MRRTGLILAILAVVAIAAACTSSGANESGPSGVSPSQDQAVQSGSAGNVAVEASWLPLGDAPAGVDLSLYPADRFRLLQVKLDTHSGDLRAIDVQASTELRRAAETEKPVAWASGNDDSHHRQGVLVFAKGADAGPVQLVIKLPDGEVSLSWGSLPQT